MSDAIKHECGIAFIRLLKPLEYYAEKYGSAFYGLKKLYLLMEKQHNRGQDGAGVATIKLDVPQGSQYINLYKTTNANPISDIFSHIYKHSEKLNDEQRKDAAYLKKEVPFMGEVLLGHLRYGTHSKNTLDQCHPFHRQNNWMSRNLVLAGNFNITNVQELFHQLLDLGQHPMERADTVLMLEKIGHFLDAEVQEMFRKYKDDGHGNIDISDLISRKIDIQKVLKRSFKNIDGGYTMAGMMGHGDAFIIRDPNSIRPAFYYHDDEVFVATSERPAIQTAFNVSIDKIKEIGGGNAIIIRKSGEISEVDILPQAEKKSCSFERIYFSRGNDADIYQERKMLGQLVSEPVLKSVNYDIENTVFSYIPNTAATSFYGMIDGVHNYLTQYKKEALLKNPDMGEKELEALLSLTPRREKIAIKDAKLRTFITDDQHRDDLVAHVYDVTYGVVKPGDTLVVMDDSIVRGTTLKMSILRILDRLGPKKIVIVSSAPQIRYPDCYGIDMSRLKDFVAFQAVLALIKENGLDHKLHETYEKAKYQLTLSKEEMVNAVNELYELFTVEQITKKISQIVTPEDINAEVEVIYQPLDNLHQACPHHSGDWYFSGIFPTPGGTRVANKAFINFMEGSNERAY